MPFHRLSVPAYWGGLPGGYDYVNNALAGVPSFADNAKIGGPNAGTYFCAFGEDATSSNVNRMAKALSENTDYLDNLLRRDIAVPVRTSDGVGAPTASLLITGPGVFMGLLGAQLKDLFHITDTNDQDIDVAGTKIVVSGAVDSGGVLVGGGFSNGNVTATFNIAIPGAQGYRIYYAERGNWATFPADGLTSTRIRNLTEVDYQVEEVFRLLHGNNETWNAAWDSTVWDLTARGMDGAYRRSTTGVAGAFNTAGSGAVILRDGIAPAVVGQQATRAYIDEYQQLQTAKADETGADRSTHPFGSGGYFFQGHTWDLKGSAPAAQPTPGLYSFASVTERTSAIVGGAPIAGQGYATKIPAGAAANIYTTGTAGVLKVVLTAPSYFFLTWVDFMMLTHKQTAVGVGRDLLKCVIPGIGTVALVITAFDFADVSGATAHCSTLDGGTLPTLPAGPTAITVTWASPRMLMGEGGSATKELFAGASIGAEAFRDDMFFCAPPAPPLTMDVTDATGAFQQHFTTTNAYFGAHIDYTSAPPYTKGSALSWGTLQRDATQVDYGQWQELGKLLADGTWRSTGGNSSGLVDSQSVGSDYYGFRTGGAAANQYNGTDFNFSKVSGVDTFRTAASGGAVSGFGLVKPAVYSSFTDSDWGTGAGSPYTVDFTSEQSGDAADVAVPQRTVIARRFFTGGGAVTINAVKLPLNADIGQKFYLMVSEVDNTAQFNVNLQSCVDRQSAADWRISLFLGVAPLNVNQLFGVNGVTEIFEFTCVYSGGGFAFTKQTTYALTGYTIYSSMDHNYVFHA